ncbi:hypothetical protein CN947_12990 [Bacillus cereus]|nr:hypothetical protein CN947_12990 [Bacillus cereus]
MVKLVVIFFRRFHSRGERYGENSGELFGMLSFFGGERGFKPMFLLKSKQTCSIVTNVVNFL